MTFESIHRHGRAFWVIATLVLSGCGGGGEAPDRAPTSTSAPTASPPTDVHILSTAKIIKPHGFAKKGVTTIAVSADGKTMAAGDASGKIRLLDPSSARDVSTLKTGSGLATTALLFSPDGRGLLSANHDSTLEIWNVSTSALLITLWGHESGLRSMSASTNGLVVATAGEDTRVLLWNGSNGRLLKTLLAASDFVNTVSVSPDGVLIAAGGSEARVFIWDAASGKLLHTLLGHADGLNSVAFSPDGLLIASAGEDGKVILWNAASGQEVQALAGQKAAVQALAFSPDGALLAGGAKDGGVIVWDMSSRQVTQQFAAPGTVINAVAFSIANKTELMVGNDQDNVVALKVK